MSEKAALPEVDLDPADPDADPVVLRDVATNRAIECFLHSYCTVTGEADKFVVGIPVDPCVDICEVDSKTDELITLDPDGKDMDAIFPVAAALLAEDDLTLLRSATTVTLQVIQHFESYWLNESFIKSFVTSQIGEMLRCLVVTITGRFGFK